MRLDLRGAVCGKPMETHHISMVRSCWKNSEEDLPLKLSSDLHKRIRDEADYISLAKKVDTASITLERLANQVGIPCWNNTLIRDKLPVYQGLVQKFIGVGVVTENICHAASEIRSLMQKCKNYVEMRAAKELAKFQKE